jgi:queuine tRNA-ribosyltransferase
MGLEFRIKATDKHSQARRAELLTSHGVIQTPIFMPVGTAGTVKAVHQRDLLQEVNAEIILGNTYHLYLRPGTSILQQAGGLHQFMNWPKPILTDSGGYQVYSLANNRKITEEGVKFKSHIDGSNHFFSPESVMDIERAIGADIIMAFDECTPYPCDFTYARKSMEMTHRWLDRCIIRVNETEALYKYEQTLFPIVQGSTYAELRKISAEYIASKGAGGNAIGGLSVGEPAPMMYESVELVNSILPKDKPRYLMGVGTPTNILENIALGVDMFDCVMPTRNARNGMLFTWQGKINIRNEKWKDCFEPIDEQGTAWVDQTYTKAYLRHLFYSGEMLGPMMASVHNLAFYLDLVRTARTKIEEGVFWEWKNSVVQDLDRRL